LKIFAVLTGAQVISADIGLKLDQVGLEVLGTARRVVVAKITPQLLMALEKKQLLTIALVRLNAKWKIQIQIGIKIKLS
jgi:chaperonin GroEL (HSP60 family)